LDELVISSTGRTPKDQARVMYENEVAGKSSSYGKPGREVLKLVHDLKDCTPDEIKQAMEDKINEVGPTKVSKHASDPKVLTVVDIPVSFINSKGYNTKRDFINAVEGLKKAGLISNFLHPGNNKGEQAYHIEIPVTNSSNNNSSGPPVINLPTLSTPVGFSPMLITH
jgi:hypothetical protein